jgi:hypothetical protein
MKGGNSFEGEVKPMSLYEALTLMIAFAMLMVVVINGQKK